jgi:hypothetical protein
VNKELLQTQSSSSFAMCRNWIGWLLRFALLSKSKERMSWDGELATKFREQLYLPFENDLARNKLDLGMPYLTPELQSHGSGGYWIRKMHDLNN